MLVLQGLTPVLAETAKDFHRKFFRPKRQISFPVFAMFPNLTFGLFLTFVGHAPLQTGATVLSGRCKS
jgi:hypothetical protein